MGVRNERSWQPFLKLHESKDALEHRHNSPTTVFEFRIFSRSRSMKIQNLFLKTKDVVNFDSGEFLKSRLKAMNDFHLETVVSLSN